MQVRNTGIAVVLLTALAIFGIAIGGCGDSRDSTNHAKNQEFAKQQAKAKAKRIQRAIRQRQRARKLQAARRKTRLAAREARAQAAAARSAAAATADAAAEEAAAAEATSSDCDPNYSGACLDPNSPDYDCAGGSGDGPDYTGYVTVVGSDPYGLDSDGDGVGCE